MTQIKFPSRIMPGFVETLSLEIGCETLSVVLSKTPAQSNDAPICFVTLGLIRECIFRADGEEHDIEERTCRSMGAPQCEFQIIIGG